MIDLKTAVPEAEHRIRPHVRETWVERATALDGAEGGRAWLKLENLQVTGSFKIRGAMNRLLSMSREEADRGIVTASSGNHGAAVALGLQRLGRRGLIFVPENVSPAKIANIKGYGAEVRTHSNDSGITEVHARHHAADHGMTYVSPYNDEVVVAGQGTIGAELARQLDSIDAVFVALGGGGLIAGIGGYLKEIGRRVEVVACSPANSAVMHHSIAAGRIVTLESLPTLSDGTAGAVEQDTLTFDLVRRYVDRYVLVSEEEIAAAMRLVIDRHHTLVEGAAGVAVAGWLKERSRYAGRDAVIVLCGANIARDRLKDVL